MNTDTPDTDAGFDPELERRSRRNKIAVTIGFVVLIVVSILMASLLKGIVKPVGTAAETPPADAAAAPEQP